MRWRERFADKDGWYWFGLAYYWWRWSPYWRGYRAGLAARDRAHERYLKLQEHIE